MKGYQSYRLTNSIIDNIKHKHQTYKVSDGDNLYLHVTPTGSKLWRFRYRYEGKEKTLSLGKYPTTSIEDARRGRDAAKELLLQGIDPSEIRKQEKARSKAELIEGHRLPSVRVGFDGVIELWKGGNVMRVSPDEARFIASLLDKIIAR